MAIKLKMELKWTKIKRVVTLPNGLSLVDLNNVIQAMFAFEHDHLWDFRDKKGREWSTGCNPFGEPLSMNRSDRLDPDSFCVEDVLKERGNKILYTYDYGDEWEIIVTRMADSKDDEICCVKTVGTNALEDIGGASGLAEFTEVLQDCTITSEDQITDDTDWRIVDWDYWDPAQRALFLNGPTREELTELLLEEVDWAPKRKEKLAEEKAAMAIRMQEKLAEEERAKLFKGVGRNDPCPCGSGKKYKKCCGK